MANHGDILWVNMVHPGKLGCNSYNLAPFFLKGFRAQKGVPFGCATGEFSCIIQ
jgi:hypothetical protein